MSLPKYKCRECGEEMVGYCYSCAKCGSWNIRKIPPEKCDLCGHEEKNLHPLAGHKLCEQCYLGKGENPEHSLGEKEEPPGDPRHYETAH